MKTFVALGLTFLTFSAQDEAVRGTLLDAGGKPVVGAKLTSLAITQQGVRGSTKYLVATTDSSGAFVFYDAPVKPSSTIPLLFMAQTKEGSLGLVRLESDGATVTWPAKSAGALVFRVADPDGKPVAGAKATLHDVAFRERPTPDQSSSYVASLLNDEISAVSDASGVVRFEGLPAGATVSASVSSGSLTRWEKHFMMPSEGQEESIRLSRAAVLAGRVLKGGQPVPNVEVVASTIVDRRRVSATATTNAEGEYRIANAMPGSVQLSVTPGRISRELVAIAPPSLTVVAGEERNGLNISLSSGIVVKGQVLTQESDRPVPNASVAVSQGMSAVAVKTDAEGRFTARVAPGDVYVSIQDVNGVRLNGRSNLQVTVDEGHNPPLDLRVKEIALFSPITSLSGKVLDAKGTPVANATVRGLIGGAMATTDSEGRFKFNAPLNPGDLLVATKDNAMTTKAVMVKDSPVVDIVLDGKPVTLEGVLVDQDGKRIPEVEVSLTGLADGAVAGHHVIQTNSEGAYRFEGLYGGLDYYFIWARKSGYGPATIQDIKTAAGESKKLETQTMAIADGTIEGQVLETDGKPGAGITVSSQVSDVPEAVTDAKGMFRLTGVPRGKHYLVAMRHRTSNTVVEASTGQKNVVIRMNPEPKPVAGVVVGSREGKPAPEIKVASWTNGSVDLKALKGKIVVIDLWAVWCGPCVASLPEVQKIHEKYASRGVTVIGIHAPGTPEDKVKAFVKSKGLTYANAMDVSEDLGVGVTAKALGMTGIPHILVIDASGKIVSDSNDVTDAEKAVRKLLGDS